MSGCGWSAKNFMDESPNSSKVQDELCKQDLSRDLSFLTTVSNAKHSLFTHISILGGHVCPRHVIPFCSQDVGFSKAS